MSTDFRQLVPLLAKAEVEFIIIGGVAAVFHGAARATYDLDLVYRRTDNNISRLVKALKPHSPYLRGAPPNLPFRLDKETVKSGMNFTLTTNLGDIDLFGDLISGGKYEDLLTVSIKAKLFGVHCRCLSLSKLIEIKRAVGRPKDFEVLAELEAIWDERQQ